MNIASIDLSLIDFKDKTFYTGNKSNLTNLKDSINDLGLLNPPILREKEGKYQIISGWKRLLSCRELGHREVLCSVCPPKTSDFDSIKIILSDNRDRLTELELAELLMLYRVLCQLDDKELMNDILPLLAIPSTRKHLDKFLALGSLEKEIKDAFFEDKITIEQCQMLSDLQSEDRLSILENVFLKYKLNNNESRQVIQHISEIVSIKLKSILDVILQVQSTRLYKKLDKNYLRDELKRMRYPDLSSVEEKVRTAIGDLGLPKEVNVYVNQFFESNDIEFRVKAKSSEEILKICNDLATLCEKGDIERLLSLIKEGK